MVLASIPSPSSATWRLGPLPVRAYALCVIAGIVVAVAVASRRYRRSGGNRQGRRGVMLDVAAWAVPFGLIGAAAHALLIATRHDFTHAYSLWHAVTLGVAAIGVPGAVALGAAGAWIACRRAGRCRWARWRGRGRARRDVRAGHRRPGQLVDAAVLRPALDLVVGGPDLADAPRAWLRKLRHASSPRSCTSRCGTSRSASPSIWAARRFRLSGERTFMLCAACYAVGSFWVESVRVGPFPQVLGVRYGALGDVAVFLLAVAGLYLTRPRPIPPARTSGKSESSRLVDDSPGDVMSV